MKSRIIILFSMILILFAMLIARAVYLQILPNEKLTRIQKSQFQTVVTLEPRRGVITDRNQKDLAISIAAYSLYADPKMIESPRKVAHMLSKTLGQNEKEIYLKVKDSKKRFVWLDRRVSNEIKEKIELQKMEGLAFVEESKRIYPNQNLLSQLLGFVGKEGKGLEGIESRFQEELYGAQKKIKIQRDARGRPLLLNGQLFRESPDGLNLQLTIDSELQYRLEQELLEAKNYHEADSAVGVILDAKTSEILAMASVPGFDPNEPGKFSADQRRNRAVTDPFEPGSTLKTFVLASALQERKIAPNTKINCEGGKFKIGKHYIREAEAKHSYDTITATEVLAYSSNIGTSKIALMLGAESLRKHLIDFGFNQKYGGDFVGESKGILPPTPWIDHLLANISFGHGVAVTPLQMANAYAAIANGGMLKQPFVVKSIGNSEQGTVEERQPQDLRRVLSPQEAATITLMMKAVTSPGGTGTAASVKGFPVAGKTGTAQKAELNGRGYIKGGYVASFAGFLPANDPKFVVYVAVDGPKKNGYYGAEVAAPLFSRVASYAVRKSGLAPVLLTDSDVIHNKVSLIKTKNPEKIPESVPTTVIPELKGLTLREAMILLKDHNIEVKVSGQGQVVDSYPESGSAIPENRTLHLQLKQVE